MSTPGNQGKNLLQRIGLLLLLLALPIFVRATSQVPEDTAWQPVDTRAQFQYATLPPDPNAAAVVPQTEPEATPEPMATPAPAGGGIIFTDNTGTTEPVAEIVEQPAPPVEPTQPPGVWTYESDTIQVTIERHTQGKFVYFAADIRITDPHQFWYAFSNEKYGARTEALSDIAERHNPLLAINGDYYGFHNNGIIIRGGEAYRRSKSARHLMAVEANGDLTVLTDRSEKQGVVANQMLERGVLHTFEFGPVLVNNGQAVKLNSAILRVGEGYLEPRTAIGQYGPLHYLVLVVDGRSEGYSEGCDLPTLQQLFVDYGVQTAFNLDGGGSTTLWFNGEVINHPASGDERKVSDIIMFMRE